MANLYSTISLNTPSLRSKISQSYQEKLETMLKQHFQWGKTKRSMRDMKMAKRERKKILKARNNFCSERVDSIPFLYLVPAFLSPRKAAEPSLPSYLSLGGGVLCILRGVLWGRKFSNSVTEVIIQCKFFFLLLADSPPRDLEIRPTNNGLLMRNDVQLCLAANNIRSRANETTQFSFMRSLLRENGRSLPIHWKTNLVIEWWNNCRTRISQTITIFCSTSSNNC